MEKLDVMRFWLGEGGAKGPVLRLTSADPEVVDLQRLFLTAEPFAIEGETQTFIGVSIDWRHEGERVIYEFQCRPLRCP